jgi:hypothetical protein
MFDVTKIPYTPGDIFIFAVDMDTYDSEDLQTIRSNIIKEAPEVKVVFVPDDLIEEVIHIKKENILPYSTLTTTGGPTNVYPNQPYITYCNGESDSTATKSEVRTW